MHKTSLPLGRYAKDPRFKIVQIGGQDGIRTTTATIMLVGTDYQVWPLEQPNALYPAHTTKSLPAALRYVIGEPAKVGPSGIDSWLHTDGREYAHDPATTAMRRADRLHTGDVVDFPHIDAFEIVGDSEVLHDGLGQSYTAYPVRFVKGGFNEHFRYEYGDLAPVRFAS